LQQFGSLQKGEAVRIEDWGVSYAENRTLFPRRTRVPDEHVRVRSDQLRLDSLNFIGGKSAVVPYLVNHFGVLTEGVVEKRVK
jgi:hypothetical protein